MNKLEQYLKKIDQSPYDCRDVHTINAEFFQMREQLVAQGKNEIATIADLDRQVFLIRKSFDYKLDVEKGTINGLSWQMSGTQTLEDNSIAPLYMPDVSMIGPTRI